MLGIVAGKYVMEAEWIIISLCLLITLILLYIKNKKINYTVWLFLAIIFATIGYMSCVKASLPYEFDGVVDDGDDVILDGIVFRQEQKNGKTILYLKDSVISFDSQNIESGVTILSLNEISYFYEGSHILAEGSVSLFRIPTNDGEFDEASYYKAMGVSIRVIAQDIKVDNSDISEIKTGLTVFRYKMKKNLERIACERDSGILMAMILGEKSEIDTDIKELYQMSGISHLISISGLHVSIIGMMIYKFLRKTTIPIKPAAVISYVIMLMFGFITGFGVSATRAIIMFFVMIGSYILGRTYCIYSSLALAAIIILIDKPLYLFYSGFQLSFLAVLGISLCSNSKKSGKILSGLGISLFTLPVVLYSYYEIPLYSVILNLLVIPLAGIVLIFGIVGGMCGFLSEGLGQIFIIPSHIVLTFYEKICRFSMELPFADIIVGRPKIPCVFIYYAVLLALVIYIKSGGDFKRKLLFGFTSIFIMWNLLCYRELDKVQITFLDVGQGDCIFLRTCDDINILIDGGSSSVKNVGKYKMLPYLKCNGIKKLDYVILSHPDNDHTNGFLELVDNNYKIDNVMIAKSSAGLDSYVSIINSIKEKNISITCLEKGDYFSLGDLKLNCIHPDKEFTTIDENDESVVIELDYKGLKGLFTGDISSGAERSIISSIGTDYLFLKVAHHGSKNSSSMEFLNQTNPKVSIISCGKNNRYGHPNIETLNRLNKNGTKVIRTDESGMITITIDDENVELTEFLG